MASFLAGWAVRAPADRVLEPSAGDGAFVEAVARARRRQVDAVELYPDRGRQDPGPGPDRHGHLPVTCSPGHRCPGRAYDAVVGNPPFIRYQTFPERHRAAGFARMREAACARTD